MLDCGKNTILNLCKAGELASTIHAGRRRIYIDSIEACRAYPRKGVCRERKYLRKKENPMQNNNFAETLASVASEFGVEDTAKHGRGIKPSKRPYSAGRTSSSEQLATLHDEGKFSERDRGGAGRIPR